MQGKLTEGALWQDIEWQLPINGIDFGPIPIESTQERKVAVEVKDECVVETDLPGLAVFPTRLSAGPHTLSVEYNAQGKLPGMLLQGHIILRSATDIKTIVVTGQVEQPKAIIQPEEEPPLAQYESSYHLQDKAARSLLLELGTDEDKDLLKQWQREGGQRLYKQMRGRASGLLSELIGQMARVWYVKRLGVDTENEEEEVWELTRATDRQAVPDIVTTRKKTLCLILNVHREGRGKPKLKEIHFPKAEVGVRPEDLASLPIVLRLAVSVNSDIPPDLMKQIRDLPIKSDHELDGDQVQGWQDLLQLQEDQYKKLQYWVRYTSHEYRNGASKVTFFLDKDALKDSAMEPLSYQELLERTRKTKKELHMLFPSLPGTTSAKKGGRGQGGVKIGTLEQVHADKAKMTISLEQTVIKTLEDGSYKLPTNGYLHYDAYGDVQQIRYQQRAINHLQQGESLNPALPEFFFHADKARSVPVTKHLQAADLLSGTCNSGQIAAIEAALAAPDLLLIQGPPGTGKTTVIAEICYQVAQRGGRTLIASQSNLAVDNALSRLIHRPSIRALRKGNTESVEVEGRDFTDERVVEKWLTNTANDCQSRLKNRQKNIELLETLLSDTERFPQYYEMEKQWENKKFSLQNKLERGKQEILKVTDQQAQSIVEEKKYIPLQTVLSAIVTGDRYLHEPALNILLKDAFQYIAETGDKKESTECLQRCLQIVERVGLTFPEGDHLLQGIVWLKKTVSASNVVWTESKKLLNQIDTAIAALSIADDNRKRLESSIQNNEAQLPHLSSRIKPHWQTLQSLTADKDTLQRAATLYQNVAERIASTFQQFIDFQVEQQPAVAGAPIYPTLEQFFSEEIVALIKRYPSATFFQNWSSVERAIQQYIQQTAANINMCKQVSRRLAYCDQRFRQLLLMRPEINQELQYIGSGSYSSGPYDSAGLKQLVGQIESNLDAIEEILTKAPSFFDRLLENRNKQQLLQYFQATRNLLTIASNSEQNMPAQRRHASAQLANEKALFLSHSFQYWLREQLQRTEAMYASTLEKKDQLVSEHKQIQRFLTDEKAQLSVTLNMIKEQSEKLATLFQDLHRHADLPIALRQIAQGYVQPQASFLAFRQDHHISYQSWIEDTQNLEADVARLWHAITSAAERIKTQLVQTQKILERQKQEMSRLCAEQDRLTTMLQDGQADLDAQRAWWERLWKKIPENLRPSVPEQGISSPEFLATMQQQFQSWQEELFKEKTFAGRYDRLIMGWVARLRDLSENDRQELRSVYLKNANVIGITCGQVNKLNYAENRCISRFDVVIIDEVSKATPPEILLVALKGKKLILIGDQRQLPPMIEEKTLEQLAEESGQDRSAFRYLNRPYFEQRYNEAPDEIKRMLYIQYRMHPDIMAAINQFYQRPLECGLNQPDTQRGHLLESALIRKDKHLIWVSMPLVSAQSQSRSSRIISARNRMSGQSVFSYHSGTSSFGEEASGTSYLNYREAEIITKICEELQRLWATEVKAGAKPKEIGVITFYGAQLALLQKKLRNENAFDALKIRVGTVDRFQGMERAIVIVSMVRNNRDGDIGFAKKDERINVAFSRAQELLIIVGCHELFCVRTRQEGAAERYSNVAKVVTKRGDFIDISDI